MDIDVEGIVREPCLIFIDQATDRVFRIKRGRSVLQGGVGAEFTVAQAAPDSAAAGAFDGAGEHQGVGCAAGEAGFHGGGCRARATIESHRFFDRPAPEKFTATQGAAFSNTQAQEVRSFKAKAADECRVIFVEGVGEELFGGVRVVQFVVVHDFQGDALAGAEFVGEISHGDRLHVSGASPRQSETGVAE